jgi:hypothetical protein
VKEKLLAAVKKTKNPEVAKLQLILDDGEFTSADEAGTCTVHCISYELE